MYQVQNHRTTLKGLNHKKEPFFSIKMDLIIDFFKLGFLIISYRRRFCFFSLHHLFFRFLETTKTSPNSLKTSINTKGYADRNFSQDHKDSHEKIKSSAKLIYCFIRRRESSKSKIKIFLFENQLVRVFQTQAILFLNVGKRRIRHSLCHIERLWI